MYPKELTAGPGGPSLPAAPGKPVAPLTKEIEIDLNCQKWLTLSEF